MRPRSSKELLSVASLKAFLVSDVTNIRYLTGLNLSAGILLVLPRRFVLFVDDRYKEMAEKNIPKGFAVRDSNHLVSVMQNIREIGIEADKVSILRLARWKRKFPHTKFVRKIGVCEEFRRSKEPQELQNLHRAEKITIELLRRIPFALRKGTTEERLARDITIWALELGAEDMSFDPIVAFGTHTSVPHHRPTNRTLMKGHIVQIDIGAKYRGYCADRSEVFFTAKPTKAQKFVYETLSEARDAAIDLAKAGASTHALDRAARKILAREGMESAFTHSLGHGVGLDIHEGVILSRKAKEEILLKNEVITIEPGVYFPGKFGMRLESMVYVK